MEKHPLVPVRTLPQLLASLGNSGGCSGGGGGTSLGGSFFGSVNGWECNKMYSMHRVHGKYVNMCMQA